LSPKAKNLVLLRPLYTSQAPAFLSSIVHHQKSPQLKKKKKKIEAGSTADFVKKKKNWSIVWFLLYKIVHSVC
jgi:hypothetical protein